MWFTIYDIVLLFFELVLNAFFREVKTQGSHKIPKEGPVIIVAAPHANMFVDGMVFTKCCPRPVLLMISINATKYKYVGSLARSINASKPKDLAEIGKGRILLNQHKEGSLHIIGIDTEFTKQLKVGGQIALPNDYGLSEISEILSDTELVIKKEFKGLKALEILTQSNGTSYKYLPHVDQSYVYKTMIGLLNAGKCIGLFPEGRSHDRAELLALKGGVANIALGAMAANPSQDIKIVPCGLNYFNAHQFRSRVIVKFGSPISIPLELIEKYNSKDKKEACDKLLGIIYNGLKSVTINAPDYETLTVIRTARYLYKYYNKLGIHDELKLDQRFIDGYTKFKDNPHAQETRNEIIEYARLLKYHGLEDYQVQQATVKGFKALMILLYRMLLLILCNILCLPGKFDYLKFN
ncbi:10138_t:CDS:2 [Dentiscutata heterogama]|uniref:10138_t:CDS:1 n=1 Tax=Dentiscutata heterogama TaxID=1316150 RepID=A0ACA9KLP8_9GLOM|nr:10138_t:CDS:2 [Dentiscutata heterogama]